MRRTALAMTLSLTAFTLAACAAPAGQAPAEPTFLEVQPRWTSCQETAPDPDSDMGTDAIDLPPVGGSFPATAVVVCAVEHRTRPDGGEDLVATESRATDIEALLAALRLPDEALADGACTLELRGVEWFALLDDLGRWVRPGLPTDACGKIRMEVIDAVAGLQLTQVSSRVLREIVSAEAAATGCAQQWGDMVWVETSQPSGRSNGTAVAFDADQSVRLCRYAVPDSERGSSKPGGDFESGVVLTAGQWPPIAAAIEAAPIAAECSTQATRFAVLRRTDNLGGEIYVELDGCRRVMTTPVDGPPALVQADTGLIASLTKVG